MKEQKYDSYGDTGEESDDDHSCGSSGGNTFHFTFNGFHHYPFEMFRSAFGDNEDFDKFEFPSSFRRQRGGTMKTTIAKLYLHFQLQLTQTSLKARTLLHTGLASFSFTPITIAKRPKFTWSTVTL